MSRVKVQAGELMKIMQKEWDSLGNEIAVYYTITLEFKAKVHMSSMVYEVEFDATCPSNCHYSGEKVLSIWTIWMNFHVEKKN